MQRKVCNISVSVALAVLRAGKSLTQVYPELASLRAYRAHHPLLRVYTVTRNGRTVWLTWKQYNILRYAERSEHRNRRLRLEAIAKACQCSIATVSRALRRFDLWRFFDLATWVGRKGGVWVQTRAKVGRSEEADANLARARHTYQSRKIARDWLSQQIILRERELRLWVKARRKSPMKLHHSWVVTSGSMDAMFYQS